MEILFASGNRGKHRELESLLTPIGYRIRLQSEFDIAPVAETGLTFVENALLKARHACRSTGLAALADDSGLEVDALMGAPGLYSSRYAELAGEGSGDQANIESLLRRLEAVDDPHRTARFRCVLVLLRHTADPSPLIAEGTWEGRILRTAIGDDGFGYDPVFADRASGESAASMTRDEKNRVSHRAIALRTLVQRLPASPPRSD